MIIFEETKELKEEIKTEESRFLVDLCKFIIDVYKQDEKGQSNFIELLYEYRDYHNNFCAFILSKELSCKFSIDNLEKNLFKKLQFHITSKDIRYVSCTLIVEFDNEHVKDASFDVLRLSDIKYCM